MGVYPQLTAIMHGASCVRVQCAFDQGPGGTSFVEHGQGGGGHSVTVMQTRLLTTNHCLLVVTVHSRARHMNVSWFDFC